MATFAAATTFAATATAAFTTTSTGTSQVSAMAAFTTTATGTSQVTAMNAFTATAAFNFSRTSSPRRGTAMESFMPTSPLATVVFIIKIPVITLTNAMSAPIGIVLFKILPVMRISRDTTHSTSAHTSHWVNVKIALVYLTSKIALSALSKVYLSTALHNER